MKRAKWSQEAGTLCFLVSVLYQQCNKSLMFMFPFADLQKLDVFEKLEAKHKVGIKLLVQWFLGATSAVTFSDYVW